VKKINLYILSLVVVASNMLVQAMEKNSVGRLLEVVKDASVTAKITIQAIKDKSTTQHVLADDPYAVSEGVQRITISTKLGGRDLSQEIAATDLCGRNDYRIRIISPEENAIDFNVEPITSDENPSRDDGDEQSQVAFLSRKCTAGISSFYRALRNNVSGATSEAMSNLSTAVASLYTQMPCITEQEKKKEE